MKYIGRALWKGEEGLRRKIIAAVLIAAVVTVQTPVTAFAGSNAEWIVENTTEPQEHGPITTSKPCGVFSQYSGVSATVTGDVQVNATAGTAYGIEVLGINSSLTVEGDVIADKSSGAMGANIRASGAEITVQGDICAGLFGIQIVDGTVKCGDVTGASRGIMSQGGIVRAGNITLNGNGCGIFQSAEYRKKFSTVKTGTVTAVTGAGVTGLQMKMDVSQESHYAYCKDITVSGTGSAVGVRCENLSAPSASGGQYAYVDGDIISSDIGVIVKSYFGVVRLFVDGTISAENCALAIGSDLENDHPDIAIVVYAIETSDTGMLFGKWGGQTCVEDTGLESYVSYIIRKEEGSESKLTVTNGEKKSVTIDGETYRFDTAAAGTEVWVKAEKGYRVEGNVEITEGRNGNWLFIMPHGGGVTLEAVKTEEEPEPEPVPANTGKPGAPVTDGNWNQGPGGVWTYRTGGMFRNTWGYIQFAVNGKQKEGWFYFDKYGEMAVGWKKIDGKWYYFNEVHDGTYGMMLTDTITPDGHRVGADGVWIP